MQMKIIPAIYDFVFKELITSPETRRYTCKLISEITGISYEVLLKNMVIKSNNLKTSNKIKKRGQTDILIEVSGTIINIEMNKDYYEGILEKNNFYHNKLLGEIYDVGSDYLKKVKVIQINFDNYTIDVENEIVNKYMIMNIKTKKKEMENYEKYHIDLAKLKKVCYNKTNKELTKIEKLCLILIEKSEERLIRLGEDSDIMEETVNKIRNISDDDFIMGLYDKEVVDAKIERTKLKYAEKVGLEKGMKKGIRQGLIQSKKEVVINMLKKHIPKNIIAECTNLSINEIDKLENC